MQREPERSPGLGLTFGFGLGINLVLTVVLLVGCQPGDPKADSRGATTAQPQPDAWPEPDPTVPFPKPPHPESPYENTALGVRYLGDARCQPCHAELTHSYHQHPMGRSAAWTREEPDLPGSAVFQAAGFQIQIRRQADGTLIHELTRPGQATTMTVAVPIVIGSGAHGKSYLQLEEGSVWQSPVSWYANLQGWHLSPGFDQPGERQRPVLPGCLFCHVDQSKPITATSNLFQSGIVSGPLAIGCERCHGPGERHVAFHENGGSLAPRAPQSSDGTPGGSPDRTPDRTIVNPKDLDRSRQMDICRQCHLQGAARVPRYELAEFDFRPGLAWQDFVSTWVQPPESIDLFHSVGQFEQLETSACYTRSQSLTCTTCHDPHASPAPASRPAFYRAKCLTCHTEQHCQSPAPARAAQQDHCTTCHMPRAESTSIAHASVIDHRIPRKANAPSRRTPGERRPASQIVAYAGGNSPAQERDRLLAWLRQKTWASLSTAERQAADDALRRELAARPGDLELWLAASLERDRRGETKAALRWLDRWAAARPDHAWVQTAWLNLSPATPAARDVALAAVQRQPSSVEARWRLARLLWQLGDRSAATQQVQAILQRLPFHPRALVLRAAQTADTDPAAAQRELDAILEAEASPTRQFEMRQLYQELRKTPFAGSAVAD